MRGALKSIRCHQMNKRYWLEAVVLKNYWTEINGKKI